MKRYYCNFSYRSCSDENSFTFQAFIDQLKIRHLDLMRIMDESQNEIVRERSEVMAVECNRILGECQRRKLALTKIMEESRIWDRLRKSMSAWLSSVQEKFVFLFFSE